MEQVSSPLFNLCHWKYEGATETEDICNGININVACFGSQQESTGHRWEVDLTDHPRFLDLSYGMACFQCTDATV